MAHMLIVGFYLIADTEEGVLKVMRSYQYYAAINKLFIQKKILSILNNHKHTLNLSI